MSAALISCFEQYRANVSVERVRMSVVPTELRPLVTTYREALSRQLADPDNESWDSLGPNDHHNALQAVRLAFGPKTVLPKGNCPRCAGSGIILAYSHVRGGRCLRCDGTGNLNF